MTKRKRHSRLRIAGEMVELDAPGLKRVKRKNGVVDLYWAKDEGALFVDYHPSTVRIHVDLSDREAKTAIERICQREQEFLERWLEQGNGDKERL